MINFFSFLFDYVHSISFCLFVFLLVIFAAHMMDFLSPGHEADQMQADQIDLKEFLLSLSRGAQSRGANGFPF